ncbi:MAG: YHS domain-containing (seleno)protein [Magnetovibrionaceae bacterium]
MAHTRGNLTRRTVLAAGMAGLVLYGFGAKLAQAADPIYTGTLSNTAVQGYDPVAYFKAGKQTKGSKDFAVDYKGTTWLFSSQANLEAFKADPEAFAPQYGGYCAWAVSQGYTAKGDADHWRIVDGKLYLNYSAGVQAEWEQNIPGNIAAADSNWPKVLK